MSDDAEILYRLATIVEIGAELNRNVRQILIELQTKGQEVKISLKRKFDDTPPGLKIDESDCSSSEEEEGQESIRCYETPDGKYAFVKGDPGTDEEWLQQERPSGDSGREAAETSCGDSVQSCEEFK
jgi:hypothetical protein